MSRTYVGQKLGLVHMDGYYVAKPADEKLGSTDEWIETDTLVEVNI